MPKMKTNSAASKRAKITGTGKVKHVGSAMRQASAPPSPYC